MSSLARRTGHIIAAWLALCLVTFRSPAGTVMQAEGGLDYLFIVDASAATAAHKLPLAKVLSAQIATGLDAQIRPGELFSVWVIGPAGLANACPPTAWTLQDGELIAAHIVRYLDTEPFAGASALDRALDQAWKVAASQESFEVVVVHSLNNPVTGTGLDANIRSAYLRQAAQGTSSLVTTTLLLRRGVVIGWSVEPVPGSQRQSSSLAAPETPSGAPPVTPQPTLPTSSRTLASAAPAAVALDVDGDLLPESWFWPTNGVPLPAAPDLGTAATAQKLPVPPASRPPRHELSVPVARPPATAELSAPNLSQRASSVTSPVPKAEVVAAGSVAERQAASASPPAADPSASIDSQAPGSPQPAVPEKSDSVTQPQVGLSPWEVGLFLVTGVALMTAAIVLLVRFCHGRKKVERPSLISQSLDTSTRLKEVL